MAIPYASPQDAASAARFFDGYEESFRLWNELVAAAQEWGPIEVTSTKSRVCLKARTRFLWCPQAHKTGSLFVRFFSPTPLESRTGIEVRNDAFPDGRPSVRIRLTELAPEAMDWMRAAYEFDVA